MWKREGTADPAVGGRPDMPPAPERMVQPRTTGERATIGSSITIRGEVTGEEDLLIQGQVEGTVNLRQHALTIGPEGDVKADVVGRIVTVEGRVEGNITAEEQVVLRTSSVVQGDITAPRVVLEDGARFRGGVDMGDFEPARRSAEATPRGQAAQDRGNKSRSGQVTSPDITEDAGTAPLQSSP